ncbi:MAG: tRNA (adenosine(37)-N6)-dimethylallyltransferase MiaA [bacterium]
MLDNNCQDKDAPKLIVVLGPTASGKSDLAVEIAHKFNGEIISADSRQVYRGMDIGTGKITKKEMQGVPHYLLDVADPKRRFTVAQYKKLALAAIKKIQRKNKIPIICGGTGFYIQALVDNISIPEVKPDLKLRTRLEKKSVGELFSELKWLDPKRAKTIDPKNPRRLIRALEIIYKTGKPVPPLNPPRPSLKGGSPPPLGGARGDFSTLFIGVKKSPHQLRRLIYKRLLKRLRQGMIEEVKNLRKSGISWKRLEDFGLEYRYTAKYLQKKTLRQAQGKLYYQEMVSRLQKEIEHYAKRQMTWFKKNPRIKWIESETQAQKLVKKFIE